MPQTNLFIERNDAPDLNILILGASGMLGSALFHQIPQVSSSYKVFGTARESSIVPNGSKTAKIVRLDNVFDKPSLTEILQVNVIDVVINAIGLIKQIGDQKSKADFIKINAWLPHYLMELCEENGARLIEISTDCVFTGKHGSYNETNIPDAVDLYGVTKHLGEITDNPNALTIRTSIIGHESGRAASLIDWFLSSSGQVQGYKKAIFSGFPTVFLAQIIAYYILPDTALSGLYHISSNPIDKFTLLSLVAKIYGHDIEIKPDNEVIIDRSLDSKRFRELKGFNPPDWEELVTAMMINRPTWKQNE